MTARRRGRDEGFTLVELMVSMALLAVLMSGVLAGLMAMSRALEGLRATTDITGEARVALERMTRELRQAQRLTAAGSASFSLEADFDRDGVIVNDERVTYAYDAVAGELTLSTAALPSQPLLARRVSSFAVDYRSSLWQYDANADGVTTSQEIDQAIGNANGALDTALERDAIDLVRLILTVTRDGRTQTFTTSANLRNRTYGLGPQPVPSPSPSP